MWKCKVKAKFCTVFTHGLNILPLLAALCYFTAHEARAEEVNYCVELSGRRLVNNCGFPVSIAWCVRGNEPFQKPDCGYSSFDKEANIRAGGSTAANPGGSMGYISLLACRGGDTVRTNGNHSWCSD